MFGFIGGLFVVLEPGRILSRLPGLIQVRKNRVPASHLVRFVDVEPHPQWLVGAEGHRSWVVMSCSNNDLCNARRVYYVYCKLEQHEAKQAHDCESSGRILTTWRQEAKTPIIVDSRLQFVQDPIVFISVWDLQRKSGNRHPRQLSYLQVLLEYWNRRTSTSAAVAAASELPNRALSRHLPSLHPLQHLQHLRVFERCCGCCKPQPTPHPARWLERNLPKLRGAAPGKGVSTRGRSRPLPLQMSENYKIWQQETSQMKQLKAKLLWCSYRVITRL